MTRTDDWFVEPESVRLNLSGGQWIDVKKELNAGEARDIFTDLVKGMHAGSAAELDPKNVGVSKILVYVLGWSLKRQGVPIPFTRDALLSLRPAKFQEIVDAVDTHEQATLKEIEERKNDLGDASGLPSASPSLGTTTGAMNG